MKKEKIREAVNERRRTLRQQDVLLGNATTQDLFVLGQINYQPLLIAAETAKAHELAATQACRSLAVNSPVKCFRS